MYFAKTFLFSLALIGSAASSSIRGNSSRRDLVVSREDFCKPGFHLAWVTFDFTRNWTPIAAGSYVTDIGFGFTLSVDGEEDGGEQGPRIYDSNAAGGLDPDLEVNRGNLLIVQQAGSTEPNDSRSGGTIILDFENPTDVYSIQLVDTEEQTKIRVFSDSSRTVHKPAPIGDGDVQDVIIEQYDADKIKIKLAGSGGIGNIKMCMRDDGCDE